MLAVAQPGEARDRFRLQGRRRRASVGHGVVSTGAPTPELIWVSPPGDYAILNSNHIPDGTMPDGDHLCHGDFHPRNVLGEALQPILIDWPNACCGDPASDCLPFLPDTETLCR